MESCQHLLDFGDDVRGYRRCGSAQLRSQAEPLLGREHFVARYTSSVRRCAFCHTKRSLKSRIPPPTELIADG